MNACVVLYRTVLGGHFLLFSHFTVR